MKCGNCKGNHPSVDEVRSCYSGSVTQAVMFPVAASTMLPNWDKPKVLVERTPIVRPFAPENQPATEKQMAFLNKLLAERPMYRDVENLWPENVAKLSKRDISVKITEVMVTPKESGKAKPNTDELDGILKGTEDGYFAVASRTGSNDLDFFRVATNDDDSRVIQRVLGGHPLITLRLRDQLWFAELVVELTPEQRLAAQVLFGQEIGKCGRCGRSLTDETSRDRGIGPSCWAKMS